MLQKRVCSVMDVNYWVPNDVLEQAEGRIYTHIYIYINSR